MPAETDDLNVLTAFGGDVRADSTLRLEHSLVRFYEVLPVVLI
jgi:hypothetical protein